MFKSKWILGFFHCLQIAADDLAGRVEQSDINHSYASCPPRVVGRRACSFKSQWVMRGGVGGASEKITPYASTMQHSLSSGVSSSKTITASEEAAEAALPCDKIHVKGQKWVVTSPGDSYITNTAIGLEKHCSCCISLRIGQ